MPFNLVDSTFKYVSNLSVLHHLPCHLRSPNYSHLSPGLLLLTLSNSSPHTIARVLFLKYKPDNVITLPKNLNCPLYTLRINSKFLTIINNGLASDRPAPNVIFYTDSVCATVASFKSLNMVFLYGYFTSAPSAWLTFPLTLAIVYSSVDFLV